MDYYRKYLKYKEKYLSLKAAIRGGLVTKEILLKDTEIFEDGTLYKEYRDKPDFFIAFRKENKGQFEVLKNLKGDWREQAKNFKEIEWNVRTPKKKGFLSPAPYKLIKMKGQNEGGIIGDGTPNDNDYIVISTLKST